MSRNFLAQFIYLFTGVFSTCAAQVINYHGAGDQRAMLLPFCNYFGMMLVGLVPTKVNTRQRTFSGTSRNISSIQPQASSKLVKRQPTGDDDVGLISNQVVQNPPLQQYILLNVFLDFAGCIFANVGLSMAGSGIFQVMYSSVVCWSAILSKVILKKFVSRDEWVGIAMVTFGLSCSAMGQAHDSKTGFTVLIGCVNTLIGAGFYGATYVAGELTLNLPQHPAPKTLCVKIGTICTLIIALYMITYTVPKWDTLITLPVKQAQGNTKMILSTIVLYTISQLAHGLTYFMMLGTFGSVTTGIMQSLRAILVFALSSILFCSHQESQCFDTNKTIATIIVVFGVMYYSWGKGKSQTLIKRRSRDRSGKIHSLVI